MFKATDMPNPGFVTRKPAELRAQFSPLCCFDEDRWLENPPESSGSLFVNASTWGLLLTGKFE